LARELLIGFHSAAERGCVGSSSDVENDLRAMKAATIAYQDAIDLCAAILD
jgi:hypothetical protein